MVDKIEEICLKILERIGLKKISDWYRKHQEGMRYLVIGALSTLVNILVYILFSKLILRGISEENIRVNASEIIAFIIAVLYAYVTNKIYVFKSNTKSFKELLREMVSFTGCRIFTELVSILMMNMAIWFNINDVFMKIVCLNGH